MIEQYWSINSDAFSIFVHSTKFPFLRDIVLMKFFFYDYLRYGSLYVCLIHASHFTSYGQYSSISNDLI